MFLGDVLQEKERLDSEKIFLFAALQGQYNIMREKIL
jgi:hypothetical protein